MADRSYFSITDVASGGVVTKDDPRELADNESPYILNMDIKNKGRVISRTGYELWQTFYTPAYLTGGTGANGTFGDWAAITNTGQFAITINGTAYEINPDFTGDGSMADVAASIQTAIRAATGSLETVTWSTNHFVISSCLASSSSAITVTSTPAAGTDISGAGASDWMDCDSGTGNGVVTNAAVKTNAMRGLGVYYRTYGSPTGEWLLAADSGGCVYSNTNAPLSNYLGSFGTDSGSFRFTGYNNLVIGGNGLAANTPVKWDGTTLASLGGTPPDTKIFGQVNHSLFGVDTAAPTTIQWSDIDNPEVWAAGIASNTTVGLGDGQDITWVGTVGDQPIVLKERSKWPLESSFDSSDICLRFSVKEKKDSSGGCIATGSVVPLVNGQGEVIYYLSEGSFQSYGAIENFSTSRNPAELSFKIKPTVKRINYQYADKVNAELWDDKYICLVPFEHSQTNDYSFVFSTEFGSWTLYNGMTFADLKKFRDSNGRDMLIGASANEAKLFKFNSNFSDNGFGYERVFQSKTFTFGNKIQWKWIDLSGSKTIGSTIYVQTDVDGRTELWKIDDSHFIKSGSGGYIGDNWIGDGYMAGGFPGDATPMYDWRARVVFQTNAYGFDMKFKIYNNADGEGWSLKQYGYKIAGLNDEVASTTNTGGEAYAKPYI